MLRKPTAIEARPFSDFELTKVRYTKGHEGEPLVHATITYKGKVVGTFEDADYGGGYNWSFNDREAEEVFNRKVEDGKNTYWKQIDFFYGLHRSADAKKHLLEHKKDLKEDVECF